MGKPTGVTVVQNKDTTVWPHEQQHKPHPLYQEEIVSYHYAYSPALLTSPSTLGQGMWRYSALLPLEETAIRYPLPVGNTPLIASAALRKTTQLPHLWLKDETKTPTGSNKDRATALVLEHALRNGVTTVSCASTGNVAVSLAIGAAAAGINAVIFVPAGVSHTKLRLMLLAGATVFQVTEGYEAAFVLSRQAAKAFGWYDRNTGVNPLTLEAKKTVAFEIWEQLGGHMPDVVVVPVGDGLTLSALVKGFRELIACGVAQRLPRFIGVQAEGCQPLKRAWENNEPTAVKYREPARTIADGIAVNTPVGGVLVLKDIRECGGGFVAVSDQAMLQSIQVLASTAGVLAEPAAASALAGLAPAIATGLIEPHEVVIICVTGNGLKQPEHLVAQNTPFTIRADIEEVANAMQL